jgi:REP element-mobilizing transposase RayT
MPDHIHQLLAMQPHSGPEEIAKRVENSPFARYYLIDENHIRNLREQLVIQAGNT